MVSQISFENTNPDIIFHVNVYNNDYVSSDNFDYWHEANVTGSEIETSGYITIEKNDVVVTTEVDGIDLSGMYYYYSNNGYTISFKSENNSNDREFLLKYLRTLEFIN